MYCTIHCKKEQIKPFSKGFNLFFNITKLQEFRPRPDSDEGASSAFSKRMNGEFSSTIDIKPSVWNIIATIYRRFEHAYRLSSDLHVASQPRSIF